MLETSPMLAHELKRNDPRFMNPDLDDAEINEVTIAEFLELDDYTGLDETLAAFEHSPEYQALIDRGVTPAFIRPLLELAAEHWLDPDDIDSNHLLELIHDIPQLCPGNTSNIKYIIDELYGFWAFADRELDYRHGRACMDVLAGEGRRALECAMANAHARKQHGCRAGSPWREGR